MAMEQKLRHQPKSHIARQAKINTEQYTSFDRRDRREAVITDLNFNDLRGTAVTMLSEAGNTIQQVASVKSWGSARLHGRRTSGRWSVGSFPPIARALHRTACRSLSNLRTSIALLPDCSDQAPPVPDLPPGLSRASPPSCLRLPARHRVL